MVLSRGILRSKVEWCLELVYVNVIVDTNDLLGGAVGIDLFIRNKFTDDSCSSVACKPEN